MKTRAPVLAHSLDGCATVESSEVVGGRYSFNSGSCSRGSQVHPLQIMPLKVFEACTRVATLDIGLCEQYGQWRRVTTVCCLRAPTRRLRHQAVRLASSSGCPAFTHPRLIAGHATETGFRDGTGAEARLDRPHGVALDRDGHVLVSDTYRYAE